MKKTLGSKIKLNRETLRALESQDVEAVVAAMAPSPRPHTCTCCNTTRLTCSSVYC